jgi:HK97 family phage major capsid protein
MTLANTRSPQARKARLDEVRKRLAALRSEKVTVRGEFKQANDDDDREAIKLTGTKLLELDEDIAKAKELETRALSALAGVAEDVGQTLRHNIEAQQTLSHIAQSAAPLQGYVAIGEFMTADELCELFGRQASQRWGSVTVPDQQDLVGERIVRGIQTPPVPPLTLLDLFPAVPVGDRSVSYMQRNGIPSGADVVEHGALKPSADFDYEAVSDEVKTVAVWTKAQRQDIEDFDGLSADIQTTLSYDVRRKIEALLLAAIKHSTGIGEPTFSGWTDVDNYRDRLIAAAAEQAALGFPPDFAAVNPLTQAQLAITKAATDGQYLQTPNGPREVQSLALAAEELLVGDSAVGARIAVRSGLSISIGQESDDLSATS